MRFDSLAELEGFWSAIPQQQHKVGRIKERLNKLSMSVIAVAAATAAAANRAVWAGTLHMHAHTRREMSAGHGMLSHHPYLLVVGLGPAYAAVHRPRQPSVARVPLPARLP